MGEQSRAERRDTRTIDSIDETLAQINNQFDTHFGKIEESVKRRDALLQSIVTEVLGHGEYIKSLAETSKVIKEVRAMGSRGPNIPIPEYDGAKNADFIPWLNEFERKFAANNWPEDRKAQTLAGYLRDHAQYIYKSIDADVRADYAKLIPALKEKLRTQDRERFTRQRFESLTQARGQTVTDYSVQLNEIAETALAFITNKDQRDIALRERFIAGLLPYIREQLNLMGPKTFQEALIAAERTESARSSCNEVSDGNIASLLEKLVSRVESLEVDRPVKQTSFKAPEVRDHVASVTVSEEKPPSWAEPLLMALSKTGNTVRTGENRPAFTRSSPVTYPRQRYTTMGRMLCWSCGRTGHRASACQNKFCEFHQITGHSTYECRGKAMTNRPSGPRFSSPQSGYRGTTWTGGYTESTRFPSQGPYSTPFRGGRGSYHLAAPQRYPAVSATPAYRVEYPMGAMAVAMPSAVTSDHITEKQIEMSTHMAPDNQPHQYSYQNETLQSESACKAPTQWSPFVGPLIPIDDFDLEWNLDLNDDHESSQVCEVEENNHITAAPFDNDSRRKSTTCGFAHIAVRKPHNDGSKFVTSQPAAQLPIADSNNCSQFAEHSSHVPFSFSRLHRNPRSKRRPYFSKGFKRRFLSPIPEDTVVSNFSYHSQWLNTSPPQRRRRPSGSRGIMVTDLIDMAEFNEQDSNVNVEHLTNDDIKSIEQLKQKVNVGEKSWFIQTVTMDEDGEIDPWRLSMSPKANDMSVEPDDFCLRQLDENAALMVLGTQLKVNAHERCITSKGEAPCNEKADAAPSNNQNFADFNFREHDTNQESLFDCLDAGSWLVLDEWSIDSQNMNFNICDENTSTDNVDEKHCAGTESSTLGPKVVAHPDTEASNPVSREISKINLIRTKNKHSLNTIVKNHGQTYRQLIQRRRVAHRSSYASIHMIRSKPLPTNASKRARAGQQRFRVTLRNNPSIGWSQLPFYSSETIYDFGEQRRRLQSAAYQHPVLITAKELASTAHWISSMERKSFLDRVCQDNVVAISSCQHPLAPCYRTRFQVGLQWFSSAEQCRHYYSCLEMGMHREAEMVLMEEDPHKQDPIILNRIENDKYPSYNFPVIDVVGIMHMANWQKFAQNAALRSQLVRTGSTQLMFCSANLFWGCGLNNKYTRWRRWQMCFGKDQVSQLLMKLRTMLTRIGPYALAEIPLNSHNAYGYYEQSDGAYSVHKDVCGKMDTANELNEDASLTYTVPFAAGSELPSISVGVNQYSITALIDTGASTSVVQARWVERHPDAIVWEEPPDNEEYLAPIGGQPIKILGDIVLQMSIAGTSYMHNFAAIKFKGSNPLIFGADFLQLAKVTINMAERSVSFKRHPNQLTNHVAPTHPRTQILHFQKHKQTLSEGTSGVINTRPSSGVMSTCRVNHPQLNEVTSRQMQNTQRNRQQGHILSWIQLLCLLLLGMAFSNLMSVNGKLVYPNPLICQASQGSQLWQFPQQVSCLAVKSGTHGHVLMAELQLYKKNLLQYKSEAWVCRKVVQSVNVLTYFFADERMKRQSTKSSLVDKAECEEMINYRRCSAGLLSMQGNVWATTNKLDWTYPGGGWSCCVWRHFEVTNCYLHRSFVYKRHTSKEMESTAGDVSKCRYEKGSCALDDSSFLKWTTNKTEKCGLLQWRRIQGRLRNREWLSEDGSLALTFYNTRTEHDCKGYPVKYSDQGIPYRFLHKSQYFNLTIISRTKLYNRILTNRSRRRKREDVSRWKRQTENADEGIVTSTLLAASLQAVEANNRKKLDFAFGHAFSAACSSMNAVVQYLQVPIYSNPTLAMRIALERSNIFAEAGGRTIEIWPCIELPSETFQFVSTNDSCLTAIPVKYKWINETMLGYMDPVTNIIHQQRPLGSDCHRIRQIPLTMHNRSYLYNPHTGRIQKQEHVLNLKPIQMNTSRFELPSVIFQPVIMYHMDERNRLISLNEILGGLNRQPKLATRNWAEVKQSINDGMRDFARWKQSPQKLGRQIVIFWSAPTPRVGAGASRTGTFVTELYKACQKRADHFVVMDNYETLGKDFPKHLKRDSYHIPESGGSLLVKRWEPHLMGIGQNLAEKGEMLRQAIHQRHQQFEPDLSVIRKLIHSSTVVHSSSQPSLFDGTSHSPHYERMIITTSVESTDGSVFRVPNLPYEQDESELSLSPEITSSVSAIMDHSSRPHSLLNEGTGPEKIGIIVATKMLSHSHQVLCLWNTMSLNKDFLMRITLAVIHQATPADLASNLGSSLPITSPELTVMVSPTPPWNAKLATELVAAKPLQPDHHITPDPKNRIPVTGPDGFVWHFENLQSLPPRHFRNKLKRITRHSTAHCVRKSLIV